MSNGRIAVLCPTRDRPQDFAKLAESVLDTSKLADVIAYIDDDQIELYRGGTESDRIILHHGPRKGPVASANELVRRFPKYDIYGLVTDDSVLTMPAWDDWALETVKVFPNRICVISPYHNQGNHVDMPFVTREWIDVVWWYACPDCRHYSWPIITGLIGEMSAIVHAPKHGFAIHHEPKVEMVSENALQNDAMGFFRFVSLKLPAVVERLRAAMSE